MPSVRLTGRGGVLLVAALVSLLVAGRWEVPALRPVVGLLLGLLALGAVAVLLMPRRLQAERSQATRVLDHGAAGSALVTVANRSPVRALDLRWRAMLPAALGGPVAGSLRPLGPARSRTADAEVVIRLTGDGRGRHDLGPVVVEVRDPFGVVVRRRRVTDTADVVVLPRRVPLPRLPVVHGSGTARDGRPSTRRRGGGEDDVVSRAYQPGDPPKRIDWRTTARRGELMVRQDEQATSDQVAVAVDLGAGAATGEWALVAGASMLTHFVNAGHAVTTIVPGHEARTVVGGRDSWQPALVELAELSHRDRDPIDGAPADGRPVAAALGVVDVGRAREWVAALRRSAQVVALVAGDSGDVVLDVLRSAGWRVVAWDETDDVAAAWSGLGREADRVAP